MVVFSPQPRFKGAEMGVSIYQYFPLISGTFDSTGLKVLVPKGEILPLGDIARVSLN